MPPRALRAALLGTSLALLFATPSSAATINVAPSGDDASCSPCKTLSAAVTRAEATEEVDAIRLAAGGYAEAGPVVVNEAGISITGAGPATVVAALAAGDTIRFEEAGSLADIFVVNGAGGGTAVAAHDSLTMDRVNALSTKSPALSVVSPGAGDGTANAITADSSLFTAPPGEFGITAVSEANSLLTGADDVTIGLRHVTVAGPEGARGISLDSSAADGTPCAPIICIPAADPAGNLTATLTDSIVDGDSLTANNPGGATAAPNTAKIVFTGKNLADPVNGTKEGSASGGVDGGALFWSAKDFVYLLRRDTGGAAIDQGSANPAGDEPGLDVYGDPRKNGSATDLGSDEWVNFVPVASLKASKQEPAPGETVTFESTSVDPDAGFGGGIVKYYWDFGDGTQRITDGPTVTHAYATEGDKVVRLAVGDNLGAISEAAQLKLLVSPVKDVAAPVVKILQPRSGQRLRLRGKRRPGSRRRTPVQLTVLGSVTDATGIKQVDVALRLVKRRRGAGAGPGRCEFYGGRRSFAKVDCDEPVWLKVVRDKNVWRFRTRKGYRVPPGRYQLRARGTDIVGNVSSAAEIDALTVRFRVR